MAIPVRAGERWDRRTGCLGKAAAGGASWGCPALRLSGLTLPGPPADLDHLWPEALPAARPGALHRQEVLPVERQRGGQRVQGAVGEEDEGGDVQIPREVAPEAAQRLGGAVVEGSGGQPVP